MGSHLMCFHSSFTFTIQSNVCVINGSHHLVGLFTISKCSCHVSHSLTSNFLVVPNGQENITPFKHFPHLKRENI